MTIARAPHTAERAQLAQGLRALKRRCIAIRKDLLIAHEEAGKVTVAGWIHAHRHVRDIA